MLSQEQINDICDAGKMIYCFDLDDTICWQESIEVQIPRPEVIRVVNNLYENGNYIIILTAREVIPYDVTEKWLKEQGVKYHDLQYGKPKAHIYIDDCCVNINDYLEAPYKYDKEYRDRGNDINKMIRNGLCGKTTH